MISSSNDKLTRKDEYRLCFTDDGILRVIPSSKDQLTEEQEKEKYESIKIFSLQRSISDENLILLSTNNGLIFVNYSYDKYNNKYSFYLKDRTDPLFKDKEIQGLL